MKATTAVPEDGDRLALYGKVARASNDDDFLLDFLEKRCARLDATVDEAKEAVELLSEREDEGERLKALLHRSIEIAEVQESGLATALWAPISLSKHYREAGDLAGASEWLNKAAEATTDEARNRAQEHLDHLNKIEAAL